MTTCTLAQTDNYVETLTIRPVMALPGSFEILIQSQLLSAKDPSALRVQHRVIVMEPALAEMTDAIDRCLLV